MHYIKVCQQNFLFSLFIAFKKTKTKRSFCCSSKFTHRTGQAVLSMTKNYFLLLQLMTMSYLLSQFRMDPKQLAEWYWYKTVKYCLLLQFRIGPEKRMRGFSVQPCTALLKHKRLKRLLFLNCPFSILGLFSLQAKFYLLSPSHFPHFHSSCIIFLCLCL